MKGRLLSIDVLRGLTIIFMIIVNQPGSWGHVYSPLLHAEWNGLTPTDYIAMSGGVTDFGSQKNIIIYRNGNVMQYNVGDILKPGDQLYIPANLKYRMFGHSNIIQTATAILSLYLTFLAIQ